MLSLPLNKEETVLISSSRWARDATSQTEPVTRNPFVFHSCKHTLSWASSQGHVCMEAPRLANSSTTAYLITTCSSKL